MAKRGSSKPIPTVLKRLHGNPGKRRISTSEPQGVGDLWAAPAWFDREQRASWAYTLDHAPPGLLTGTDRQMLISWVGACCEYERAARRVREDGQVVKTKNGHVMQNPHLGIMNRQALILIRAANELGFTPTARASLGAKLPEGAAATGAPARSRLQAYLDAKPDKLDS